MNRSLFQKNPNYPLMTNNLSLSILLEEESNTKQPPTGKFKLGTQTYDERK